MRTNTRLLLIALVLFASTTSYATNYFVKQNGGTTTSGLSDATAWNYATLNSKTLSPGDSVLFKRGETFFGELIVRSGSSGKPVYYGAYGQGSNPVISGLVTVTNWTPHSGNIFFTDLSTASPSGVNLVTLSGNAVAMGRYPNSGYLNYTAHTSNTSISGAAIRSLPFNAAGGEAVVRKVRWILDRHPITAHSGSTLSLSTTSNSNDGGYLGYEAVDKNGFFIQNHLSTLDRDGEWFFDKTARRLYMFLSSTGREVKVSVVERLISFNSKGNISLADIDFEGSNTHAASINGGFNIQFERCRFYNHGQTAIYGNMANNVAVREGSIQHCLNNGIWIEQGGNGVKVESLRVSNIGTFAGAGRSGDGAQQAISVAGNNTTVRNCTVIKSGYNGIHFDGSNALVENNLVDSFCLVKDDGGGIYTYEGDHVIVSNRIVRNNIVLHAVGAFAGAEANYYEQWGKAAGIYLDGNSNHTLVTQNVVAHGEWAGIFVNNNSDNQIASNLFYNHAAAVLLLQSRIGNIRNMSITGNEFIALKASQKTLCIQMYERDNPALFGTFNLNYYARPVDDTKTIAVEKHYSGGGEENLTLAQWQSIYGVDAGSGKSTITTDNIANILFDYNPSTTNKVVSLKGTWKDIHSTVYQSSLTIPSFGGKVVLNTGTNTSLPVKENSFTAVQSGSHIRLNWKGIGETDALFEVERSANGIHFSKIGEVKASGLSTETAYTFLDNQPLTPMNHYRLKTVETNGSFTYTKVISVRMNAPQSSMQVYPNPASHVINVQLPAQNEEVTLKVMDMSGRTINAVRIGAIRNALNHSLDISTLPRGQYVVTANQMSVLFVKQ